MSKYSHLPETYSLDQTIAFQAETQPVEAESHPVVVGSILVGGLALLAGLIYLNNNDGHWDRSDKHESGKPHNPSQAEHDSLQ